MVWTKHLCRICAQIGDACYPIFNTNDGRNIAMKMKKCFSFVIFRDDNKPKEVCNCCYMKLNQLYEFVELCYSSNNKFETMVYSNQGLWLDKQTQNYDCQLTNVIINTKTNLGASDVIIEVDYDNSIDLNQTTAEPVCLNATFNNELSLRTSDINKEDTNANFKTYQCYEQNQTVLRHSSDFYKSIQSNNNFMNLDENIVSYDNLDNRYNKLIDKTKILCNIATIDNNDELQPNNIDTVPQQQEEYLKVPAKRKIFSCPHCSKTFVRKLSLVAHLSIHTKVRPFICDICCKTFAIERDLKSHKKLHNNIYKCKYCAKSFTVPSKLERHLRIHTNTKPFICPIENCGKSFSDKCNLEGHKLSHSDERKFICDICSKSCKTNSQLKDHKKVHDNETPFKCHVCGKMYKWKNNLTVHMKKHEGYKCLHCNKECEKLFKFVRHKKFCKPN